MRSALGRRGWLLVPLAASLLLSGLVHWAAQPAAAVCAAPEITVTPGSGAAGATIVVNGKYFADGCNDVFVNGERPEPTPPRKGIVITFGQNGRTWNLGTVDAGEDYTFTFKTAVPLEVRAGSALVDASGWSVDFTVTKARPATAVRRQPRVTG